MRISAKKNKVGIIELLFTLYGILIYYSYGVASVGDFLIALIGLYAFVIKKTYFVYKPLFYLLLFIILHEIILTLFLKSIPGYFINSTIITIFNILIVGFIVSVIDPEKLYNSFVLLAIICMIGLVYHFTQIYFFHQYIHPIKIPFLPELGEKSRLLEFSNRPVSFFPEPASYASFMAIPLFWSLQKKKMILSLIFTLSILLSTSTNGFVYVAVLWISTFFTGNFHRKYKFISIVLLVIIVSIVVKTQYFDAGINKIERTDYMNNVRLVNGPILYFRMPLIHQILGVDAANLSDYVNSNSVSGNHLVLYSGVFYASTFWLALGKYGVLGLFFYLLILIKLFKKTPILRPYILVLFFALFSDPTFLGGVWVMQTVVLLVIYVQNIKKDSELINIRAVV